MMISFYFNNEKFLKEKLLNEKLRATINYGKFCSFEKNAVVFICES